MNWRIGAVLARSFSGVAREERRRASATRLVPGLRVFYLPPAVNRGGIEGAVVKAFPRLVAAGAAVGVTALVSAPVVAAGASPSATPVNGEIARAMTMLHAGMVRAAANAVYTATAETITQPGAPTDVNDNPVNEPRAAIVSSTADYTTSTLSLSLTPAEWTNPLTDPNWQTNPANTGFGFVLLSSQSAQTGYVVTSVTSGGRVGAELVSANLQQNTATPVSCPGLTVNLGQTSHSYGVTVPDSCIGTPAQLTWIAALGYDPVANDTSGAFADSDLAPDDGNFLVVTPTGTPATHGYWEFARDGGVFTEGNAPFYGSLGAVHLNQPIVAAAATPATPGYVMAASDGGVFDFGSAHFYGSTGNVRLAQPIVALAEMPKDDGYWLFARDGGVFSFGSAKFHGSLGNVHLTAPIVAGFAAPGGTGYTLVASDGGVFTFGTAPFHGSLGGVHLAQPIVAAAPTPSGNGYWLFARDGGVFTFGDANFLGSLGGVALTAPIVGASAAGTGYRLVASDGGVFSFGAPFEGSQGGHPLAQPIVAMATSD